MNHYQYLLLLVYPVIVVKSLLEVIHTSTPKHLQCLRQLQQLQQPPIPVTFFDWYCLRMKENITSTPPNPHWLRMLIKTEHPKRQSKKHSRVRKEYRVLSDDERTRFHSAMNHLKKDILPDGTSKFDAIAKLHTGAKIVVAHDGPGFLTWHRQFLLILEDALREYDPDVAIPYWDSTMDYEMADPSKSILFHHHFMGISKGIVMDGPFNNWPSPAVPITRQTGKNGRLFSRQDIEHYLNQTLYANITAPYATKENNIEVRHGDVHAWVGGHMQSIQTAAFDPLFYLHHCFIDLLYELFRQKQIERGVNLSSDWPELKSPNYHFLNAKISISDTMTHADMVNLNISNIYSYERRPTCFNVDSECGSPYLKCSKRHCVPLSVDEYQQTILENINKSETGEPRLTTQQDNTSTYTVCLESKKCNSSKWMYIPVSIASRNISTSSQLRQFCSVYNTDAYDMLSIGLSYDGLSTSNLVHRVSSTLSVGVIGIQQHKKVNSSAIIHVFTRSGNLCSAQCLQNANYSTCLGTVQLSNVGQQDAFMSPQKAFEYIKQQTFLLRLPTTVKFTTLVFECEV